MDEKWSEIRKRARIIVSSDDIDWHEWYRQDVPDLLAALAAAEQRAEIADEKRLVAEQYGQQRARLAAEYKRRAELTEGLLLKCDEAKREAERLFLSEHDKLTKWIERAESADQHAAEAKPVIQKLIDVVNEMWGYDDILLPTTAKEWKDLANKINSAQADAAK